MRRLLPLLLGIPLTAADRARSFDSAMGPRQGAEAVNFILQAIIHNTGKAGALLAAQGMFVVVATYGSDHGWPSALSIPAMVQLLVGSLLAMTILRGTGSVFERGGTMDTPHWMFDLLLSRMLRLNLALAMTSLAVVLLLAAILAMA